MLLHNIIYSKGDPLGIPWSANFREDEEVEVKVKQNTHDSKHESNFVLLM